MNCEQVKELLSAYLDNALAAEERQHVAAHLQTCVECSNALADFRHFDALISKLPRVSPDPALRSKIFSSPEYLDLTGTFGASERLSEQTIPSKRLRYDESHRPQLVALPGGRHPSLHSTSAPTTHSPIPETLRSRRRGMRGQRVMQTLIAASILLTLGIGSLVGWNLLKQQEGTAQNISAITPPAGPQQGPIPAGTRFVFLRDGALWSAPTDGGTGVLRLTPENTTVAANWVVRPALPGRSAGNILAYIDLQQGFVHTIRSDAQSDTTIQQPLLQHGVQPSSIWDTNTGTAILNSLVWSKDGSMLAFVADPKGSDQPGLYIYSMGTGEVHEVALPLAGRVSHPVWSPDGIRVAFELTHNGTISILDYNTQNHGVLTIASAVNTRTNSNDSVLTLDWSASVDAPAITWSVGAIGHIHSVWVQHVGTENQVAPRVLITGDYVQATYTRAGHDGTGCWLLVTSQAGLSGDVISIDLNSAVERLTRGKQVSFAQWSPDGLHIGYFDTFSSGVGTLHVVNALTGNDALIATGVINDPAPVWSPDGQRLIYSTGMHVLIANLAAPRTSQQLKLQGSASAFSWSPTSPNQLVVAMSDGQQGIYLVYTQNDTTSGLDKKELRGPFEWTLIP